MKRMLDLSIIKSDRFQAVHCKTLEQAREFFFAVQEQRPDISTRNWTEPPSKANHTDKAYILSFYGCRRLTFGPVDFLKREGIEIIPFKRLVVVNELPEFTTNQSGLSEIFGL